MRKLRAVIVLIAAGIVGGSGVCWGQLTFPALSTNNVFTGQNSFTQLTPGRCVQAGTNGLLTTTAGACSAGYTLPTQYTKLRCETGLGDGTNAITAATYLQTFCYNDSGVTWTITGIKCFTDNSGTSTLNASNSSNTSLLTGAVTCSSAFAAASQSGTVTIASGDYIKFTFVSDGTTKQSTWVVSMTQ